MVGAQLIGEFAWSIENLLNKVINQTIEPTASMVSFVTAASAALPQLIEQLEIGRPPKIDVQLLMKQAEAFADGDPDAANITGHRCAPRRRAAPAPEPGMDPVLADIFVKEMRGHLDVIRQFLATAKQGAGAHSVEEPLYRACHTLLGSARMAGYEPAMKLAAPLAEHLRRYFESGVGMADKAVDALRAAAAEIETMADALGAGRPLALKPAALESLGALAFHEPPPRRRRRRERSDASPAAANLSRFRQALSIPRSRRSSRRKRPRCSRARKPRSRKCGSGTIRPRLARLQRFLHTLKGGARMAGVLPVGDLSHALETLLSRIGRARIARRRRRSTSCNAESTSSSTCATRSTRAAR